MTPTAITMMVVALVTVWGGLGTAVAHHMRNSKDYLD